MLKKRIIFTLLYDNGNFMLSRNFRLQKVGDIKWLKKNYNFSHISFFIDELIIFDVSRQNRNIDNFTKIINQLTDGCFVPITAGGGVRTIDDAKKLLRAGADKVSINTSLFQDKLLVSELVRNFGKQCVVGSLDLMKNNHSNYVAYVDSGTNAKETDIKNFLHSLSEEHIGELYLNSINQDGTGQGYDMKILDNIPKNFNIPLILAGGVGNARHLLQGLVDERVDAVATAHLFNFVGNGLQKARQTIIDNDIELACWKSTKDFKEITDISV